LQKNPFSTKPSFAHQHFVGSSCYIQKASIV
jgi:hypothetical protein